VLAVTERSIDPSTETVAEVPFEGSSRSVLDPALWDALICAIE